MTESDKNKDNQQSQNKQAIPHTKMDSPESAAQPRLTTAQPEKPKRPDPTRYGDWEKNGRAIDF